MRIATFNCNSIRMRLAPVLDWLAEHEPDVLALQETKAQDKDFPADEIREHGWNVVYKGQKSYNGVAILTRAKPEEVSFGLGDDDGESEPRLAYARVNGINILNTYVPQGQEIGSDAFAFKLRWFARLKQYLDARFSPKDPLVWVGDLNVAPEPMDVYDSNAVWPHVCHCQEVADAFAAVRSFGFVDVFRKHIPQAQVYTFWDYRARSVATNRGWRIDHILATPPLAALSASCAVDMEPRRRERPSDHTFVYADFRV